jgi:hypothetical protein
MIDPILPILIGCRSRHPSSLLIAASAIARVILKLQRHAGRWFAFGIEYRSLHGSARGQDNGANIGRLPIGHMQTFNDAGGMLGMHDLELLITGSEMRQNESAISIGNCCPRLSLEPLSVPL